MSQTVGTLAYKVKFDARQLTQGLMSTRQQLAAARKMTESMQSPLEKYLNGLENLNKILQRNTDLEKHRVTIENQLERAYLEEAAAVRVLTKEELRRLDALKLADRIASNAAKAKSARPDMAAIYREENRARGLAEQERVKRYTEAVDAETAAARKALHERLKLYKQEKAARESVNNSIIQQTANAFGTLYGKQRQQAGGFSAAGNAALAGFMQSQQSSVNNAANAFGTMFGNRNAASRGISASGNAALATFSTNRQNAINNTANAFGSLYGNRNANAAFTSSANAALAQGQANRIANVMNGVSPITNSFQNSNTFATGLTQANKALDGLVLGAKAFVGFKIAQVFSNSAAAVAEFRRQSVEAYADIESNTKIFEAFTGSAAQSVQIINDLRRLAPEVGTSFSALQDSARTLMAAGVQGPDVVDRLREMSKITLGNTERLKTMALAYSQSFNLQKLMGQERLQFSNAGFNPLVEISRTTGMGMPQLTKMMEEGKLSIDMLTKSLQTATTGSGNFSKVTELTADSTRRAMNQSSAAWEMAMTDVGEAMRPVTIGLSWMSKSLAEDISNGTRRAASAMGLLTPAIQENTAEIQKREKAMKAEADRLKERAKVTEALKKIEEDRKAAVEYSKGQLPSLMAEEYKTDPNLNKNVVDRAERIFSLLDGELKDKAVMDFAQYRNMDSLLSYLDKEVAAELRSTEAIIQKNKQLELQKNLREEGDKIARKFGKTDFAQAEELKRIAEERKNLEKESLKLTYSEGYGQYRRAARTASTDQLRSNPRLRAIDDQARSIDTRWNELNAREQAAKNMAPTNLTQSESSFAQALGNLQYLLANKAISSDVFELEKNRLARESVNFQPVAAASSIQAGSQEAYKQMIAGQLRGENKMLKEQQVANLIAKSALAAQQEQTRLQKELNEKLDFEPVGT